MGKLHELLAVEETVQHASSKLLAETNEKFHKHTEFLTGTTRTLTRLGSEPGDRALEAAARREKTLPTNVQATLGYIFPYVTKALDVKLQKHCTNQVAKADILLNGSVLMKDVPVDFLLDLEKTIPQWRNLFQSMPTLDPSKDWIEVSKGQWRVKEPTRTAQTEKVMHPVIMVEATEKHPAQVKESTKDIVVGTFEDVHFSGAATSQQKADVLALCDQLLVAVKEARMRANSVEITKPVDSATKITELFTSIFK